MAATFIDFGEIKAAVSYAEVLTMLNIKTKPEGPNKLRSACPFCKDHRSFLVTTDAGRDGRGLGGCFRCGNRGLDSIGLVARVKSIKNNEAAALIEEHFGLGNRTVSEPGHSTVPAPSNSTVPTQAPQPTRSSFDPDAYFERLDPGHESLKGLELQPETLRHFKAGYAKSGGNVGRLAIRVDDRTGGFLAYIGRALKLESPTIKAPNGFELESVIFNAHRVRAGELYVAQDPLKVLVAFEAGQENAVAFLTDGISALQWQMLAALMDERRCDKCYLF